MTAPPKIDFKALKEQISLHQAAQYLGLELRRDPNGYRSTCPRCNADDRRILAIHPMKGWTCHASPKSSGYDAASLVAHVKNCTNTKAAQMLIEHYGLVVEEAVPASSPAPAPARAAKVARSEAMPPLDGLETDHPAVELLGLTPKVAAALGIGYRKRGTIPGRVLIPLRLDDGTLVGYMGIATKAEQAPLIAFPKNLADRIGLSSPAPQPVEEEEDTEASPDELRKLFRVVG